VIHRRKNRIEKLHHRSSVNSASNNRLYIYIFFSLEFCKSRQASIVSFFQLITSVLLLFCHSVTREAERIASLCYGVKWRFEDVSKIEEEKFCQFGNLVAFPHFERRIFFTFLGKQFSACCGSFAIFLFFWSSFMTKVITLKLMYININFD
jgi:hypothetical protein